MDQSNPSLANATQSSLERESMIDPHLPSWAKLAGYIPCSEEDSTHLVVGTGEIQYGVCGSGILAYCSDQLAAWRCRREILKDSRAEVQVLLNTPDNREAIHLALCSILQEESQK